MASVANSRSTELIELPCQSQVDGLGCQQLPGMHFSNAAQVLKESKHGRHCHLWSTESLCQTGQL